jgi:peptide/nickel transport system permease protein
MTQIGNELPGETSVRTDARALMDEGGTAAVADIGAIGKKPTLRVSSPLRDATRRYVRNWPAMVSIVIVAIILVVAVFAPFMHTSDPNAFPLSGFSFDAGPNWHHFLGTDDVGRDNWSRLVYGARVTLIIGFIGTLVTVAIGTVLGLFAGYFGGAIDSLIARVTDIFLAFPAFLLALLGAALFGEALDPVFGSSGRVVLLTLIFALVSWPTLTRFVRSLGLSMREQQYVEAARTCGSSSWKIIFRHLLPNMWGLILVQAALITVGIIYTEATLTIFGLGVQFPNPDPSEILYAASTELSNQVGPGIVAQVVFPAIFFVVLLVALTFIGDGLRDAFDPRMDN